MKSEDLFAAIGGLEASRLERSELNVKQSSQNHYEEETIMYQKKHRLFPNLLVAVLIISLLATTVFAAVGFLLFDNPIQMLDTLFGSHAGHEAVDWGVSNNKGDIVAEYHSDRTPIDESVANQLAPEAEVIGRSITYAGHTLAVDANLYDAATKCGFVTYTIENPDGIRPYNVGPTGEVTFPGGELFTANQYGRSYIIQEKCTDTKLCATYYYRTMNPMDSDLEIRICFWAAIDDLEGFWALPVDEKNKIELNDSPDAIVIPAKTSSEIHTAEFGNGAVLLSPFSVQLNVTQLLEDNFESIKELKFTFSDGTDYVVENNNTINYLFNVADEAFTENALLLNRLVDVDHIAAVTVNGVVLYADA